MKNPSNSNSSDDRSYTHILQKVGVLKNFTVAKVISKREIEDLKYLIRTASSTKEEYEKMFLEEMAKVANIHDLSNPVPGIIYTENRKGEVESIKSIAKDYSEMILMEELTKKELCFLLASIIRELGLTRSDFLELKGEDDSASDDHSEVGWDDDDDDDEDEDD